ncbi:MAG: histidine--tRNA ligase [Pseudomonadota bacterium]|nr:histidine--tRNA ligase [Pseudomonadota bacterium]
MVKAVRGMRDILPADSGRWHAVEAEIIQVLRNYSYAEIRLPMMEYTDLFARGVGEATDIVEKEMYTLADRDGDSLSLRPEGTASCVRALEEHGLLYNQTQRVFYNGPMFRYEKPQKGRYRQFSQIGAEAYGFAGPDLDAELIQLGYDCWQQLGISDRVQLQLNTLGSGAARGAFRAALLGYLRPRINDLDEDSQRRLETNPLRILDSKVAATQTLLEDAPQLLDFVDAEGLAHFQQLQDLLSQLNIPFELNPNLVRGLDYYTHTVFEWVTTDLGSQGAICAGGRYDGLVERLGGRATPAVGFAIGVDRVVLLHELARPQPVENAAQIYVCVTAPEILGGAMQMAQRLRQALPGVGVRVHMGGGQLKKQFKRADASGATWAVLFGAQTTETDLVVKHLRDASIGQQQLPFEHAITQLGQI